MIDRRQTRLIYLDMDFKYPLVMFVRSCKILEIYSESRTDIWIFFQSEQGRMSWRLISPIKLMATSTHVDTRRTRRDAGIDAKWPERRNEEISCAIASVRISSIFSSAYTYRA